MSYQSRRLRPQLQKLVISSLWSFPVIYVVGRPHLSLRRPTVRKVSYSERIWTKPKSKTKSSFPLINNLSLPFVLLVDESGRPELHTPCILFLWQMQSVVFWTPLELESLIGPKSVPLFLYFCNLFLKLKYSLQRQESIFTIVSTIYTFCLLPFG